MSETVVSLVALRIRGARHSGAIGTPLNFDVRHDLPYFYGLTRRRFLNAEDDLVVWRTTRLPSNCS
jgi:hypothetical protein